MQKTLETNFTQLYTALAMIREVAQRGVVNDTSRSVLSLTAVAIEILENMADESSYLPAAVTHVESELLM
jgi:hypothetical protein